MNSIHCRPSTKTNLKITSTSCCSLTHEGPWVHLLVLKSVQARSVRVTQIPGNSGKPGERNHWPSLPATLAGVHTTSWVQGSTGCVASNGGGRSVYEELSSPPPWLSSGFILPVWYVYDSFYLTSKHVVVSTVTTFLTGSLLKLYCLLSNRSWFSNFFSLINFQLKSAIVREDPFYYL